jgi:hypothetical protein
MSKAEEIASRELRNVLSRAAIGGDIGQFAEFREILSALEWFLSEVLDEAHREWEHECLDGFRIASAGKTGDGEAELIGHGILLRDSSITPFHLRLQVALQTDEVSWLELKLGERDGDGVARRPWRRSTSPRRVGALIDSVDTIDWVYKVTYGQRRQ